MGEDGRASGGLDRLWAIWSRRKWLAISVFAFPLAAVVSLVAFMPNVYRSTALVLVDRQQVPEEFVRPTVTSALETRLQSISQEILSRARLDTMINRFGLYPDLRGRVPTEEIIERMRKDIGLELKSAENRERKATIAFAISYRGGDPNKVALVTNTLASSYIEENLRVREKQSTGTADFLKIQLAEVQGRLDEQERKVSEFKKRHTGELPQELEVNLSTLERLNAQLRLNNDNLTRALAQRDAMSQQIDDTVPGVAPGMPGAPEPAEQRLVRLRLELAELRTRFSEKYPDVIRAKAEIADLERQLAEPKPKSATPDPTPVTIVDPVTRRVRQMLGSVEAEIKVLQAEEARLRGTIATYQRRVQDTPRREQEFKDLARDYDATRELYASLLKRHAEAQLAESMEHRQKGEQFRILDPAIPATTPAAPNRPMLLLLGLALGAGLAAGAVFLAESLDTSFSSVDDLRAFTTAPILVSIPRIVGGSDVSRERRRFRIAIASAVVGIVVVIVASYLIAHDNERLVLLLLRKS
jgi:polysaccharide chain length determinant protein (PEP-CTERM system associated)